MNDHKKSWLISVKEAVASKKAGQFEATDITDTSVVIDWHIADIVSPDLAAFKKEVSDLAVQVTGESEFLFLRTYPEAVSQEMFLKSCAPFIENEIGNTNWELVHDTIKSSVKQFYLMDIQQFGKQVIDKLIDDLLFFASIKNKETGVLLGFIMASITPALADGDIKIINLVVGDEGRGHELEQLLLSALLAVIPTIKRMFTYIRTTNIKLLEIYSECGFEQNVHPAQDPNHVINLQYLIFLEYKTEESDVLQEVAKTLIG